MQGSDHCLIQFVYYLDMCLEVLKKLKINLRFDDLMAYILILVLRNTKKITQP
jgi:hypothetical protein